MPDRNQRLADTAEVEQALAHALQFYGRKQFRVSGEMMAKITAAHLADCLGARGFVVIKRTAEPGFRAPL